MVRLSSAQSKKLVLFFVTTAVLVSVATAYIIHKGQRDVAYQKKLQTIRNKVMPTQVNTELPPKALYQEVAQKIKAAVTYEMNDKKIGGLSIALTDKNEMVWVKGFGMIGEIQPATPNTIYRVASISKLFTAMAIMQLVEAGKINLDAPLQRYLPELKFDNPFAQNITIRQILSHRSGILREPPVGNYFDDQNPELAKAVLSLNNTPLHFQPESTLKYSNAAFTVLGYIIEKISGKPYAIYMDEVLLKGLKMEKSSFQEPQALLAKGEMWTYWNTSFTAPTFKMGIDPAAGLYSNMPDLSTFMRVLCNKGKNEDGESILKPETLAQMWKPQFTTEKQGFGLGFYVMPYQNTFRVQHSGVQYGIASRIFALPDAQIGVAIAANKDNSNAVIDKLSLYALDLMYATKNNKTLPNYDTLQAIPQALKKKLVGVYSDGAKYLSLYEDGQDLMLDDENRKLRLGMKNDSLFTNSVLDIDSPIGISEKKLIIGETSYQKVKLPEFTYPHRYQSLVGEYGWDHNTLFIYARYGKLYALIEWFDAYPLHEEADDFFRFPIEGLYANERIQFKRDENGRITGVEAAGIFWKKRTHPSKNYQIGKKWVKDDENVFKITPLKSPQELKETALNSFPPSEKGEFLKSELIEPSAYDPTIKLDIRYAGNRNFMGQKFYDEPRAFLQRPATMALLRVSKKLEKEGLGLLIFDAYRPWYVTKMFWDATPQAQRYFVANPQKGSKHNRGCAVDLTLYDVKTGKPLPMPSLYDEFSKRAYPSYQGGTPTENANRALLIRMMETEGFAVNIGEWWHFDYQLWRGYKIGNKRFEAL